MVIADLKRWHFSCSRENYQCAGQHTTEQDGEWVKFEDLAALLLSGIKCKRYKHPKLCCFNCEDHYRKSSICYENTCAICGGDKAHTCFIFRRPVTGEAQKTQGKQAAKVSSAVRRSHNTGNREICSINFCDYCDSDGAKNCAGCKYGSHFKGRKLRAYA